MANTKFLRGLAVALLSGLLSLGALLATALPAAAFDFAAPSFDVATSLELDAAAHVGMVVDVDSGAVQAKAFMSNARGHDLFNGDHFGLGRIDARL